LPISVHQTRPAVLTVGETRSDARWSRSRFRTLLLLAGLHAVCAVLPLESLEIRAQDRARLVVELPENPARQGPSVSAVGILEERRLRDHLQAGFPTRLSYGAELWSTGGFVNDLEGSTDWEVLVRYDRLDRSYQVVRGREGTRPDVVGRFSTLEEVAGVLAAPY